MPPDLHNVYIVPLETGVLGRLLNKSHPLSSTGKEVHIICVGTDTHLVPSFLRVLLGPDFEGDFTDPSLPYDLRMGLRGYANVKFPFADHIAR